MPPLPRTLPPRDRRATCDARATVCVCGRAWRLFRKARAGATFVQFGAHELLHALKVRGHAVHLRPHTAECSRQAGRRTETGKNESATARRTRSDARSAAPRSSSASAPAGHESACAESRVGESTRARSAARVHRRRLRTSTRASAILAPHCAHATNAHSEQPGKTIRCTSSTPALASGRTNHAALRTAARAWCQSESAPHTPPCAGQTLRSAHAMQHHSTRPPTGSACAVLWRRAAAGHRPARKRWPPPPRPARLQAGRSARAWQRPSCGRAVPTTAPARHLPWPPVPSSARSFRAGSAPQGVTRNKCERRQAAQTCTPCIAAG